MTARFTGEQLRALAVEASAPLPEPLESWVVEQPDAVLRVGEPAHYYRLLYALAAMMRPELIVELGTSVGVGACCLAAGSPSSEVWTVDVIQHGTAIERIHQYQNCHFLNLDSMMVEPEGRRIGILFVDTEHNGERPEAEIRRYLPHMAEGGVVLVDDIRLNDSMRAMWDRLGAPNAEKVELPVHGDAGFGALILGGAQ